MLVSLQWLRELVSVEPAALEPEPLAERLSIAGFEVEAIEDLTARAAGVVVGHVLQCRKHPDADRLSITLVDLGQGEPVQIVCGAPNVAVGQKVLVATVGANLCMTDGTCIIIKKSKIRGQESHGMICAEDELGLGQGHDADGSTQ